VRYPRGGSNLHQQRGPFHRHPEFTTVFLVLVTVASTAAASSIAIAAAAAAAAAAAHSNLHLHPRSTVADAAIRICSGLGWQFY
jgi:hypothetical protein